MLNTKQTWRITNWLKGSEWRDLGMGAYGYHRIVCGNVSHYFKFDADDKIVDVQTD